MAEGMQENSRVPSCDAYFETIQSRKRLPFSLQESLTAAFAKIPVSSFPEVPGGKVIEIPSDTTIPAAVGILSECNIMAAPVINPEAETSLDWRDRYLGIIDYPAIILWVLENAEFTAVPLSAGSTTGPAAVAGLNVAAGVATDQGVGKNAPMAADHLGEDFYKVILEEEPFKSTTVQSIVRSFRWAPFIPVAMESSMLTVLLLLSKYRLRNVPVIEMGQPYIKNFVTQSAVIKGLEQCKGRDWFDCIAACPISDLGLPFMCCDEVICIEGDQLILEAFKLMKDNQIGGLPVVESGNKKIIGNLSIKDIRFLLLEPGLFSTFRTLTVMDFIRTIASEKSSANNTWEDGQPVTCEPDANLGTVIETLASKSIHRIYVVSGEEKVVVGVVTLRDVISCFIYEPPNHFDNYFGFAMKEMLNG